MQYKNKRNIGKEMINYKQIKILKKEIELIKHDFNDLEAALLLCDEDIQKIRSKRDNCIKKLMDKYEYISRQVDAIDDEEIKLIIQYRVRGYSYGKIGNLMNYSKVAVFKKLQKWQKVNKINK